MLRQLTRDSAPVSTHLFDLPSRGTARVWECPGPPGADTLVLLHGLTFTAELNWGRVFGPLSSRFHVLAMDLRGHGEGIRDGSRFRLEDCADDAAALAAEFGVRRFTAVGYSMGGVVAQLLYRRHREAVSGLVLCCTARNFRGSPAEKLVALALPTLAATMQWYPMVQVVGAEVLGSVLLGDIGNPEAREWARGQLRQTSLTTALSAVQAVCDFTSHAWIGEIDVPTAVVITTQDRVVPAGRQRKLAAAIPGAIVSELHADHGVCVSDPPMFARALLEACAAVEAAGARTTIPLAIAVSDPA